MISDNALIGGYAAQVKPINAKFVEEVCRDFDITSSAAPVSSLLEEVRTRGVFGARTRDRTGAGTGSSALGESSTGAGFDHGEGAGGRTFA